MFREQLNASDILPYALVLAGGAALAVVLAAIDAFELLYAFTRAHEDWELDELIVVGFSMLIASLLILVIRVRREIDRRRLEEARIQSLIRSDPVTRLPNRVYLEEALLQHIRRAEGSDGRFAMIVLDVGGVDQIIDLHGHPAVDRVLKIIADRLRETIPDKDAVARLSGSMYALLVSIDDGQDVVTALAGRLGAVVARPVQFDEITTRLAAHLGVAIYPDHATGREKLMRCATVAVHKARASGNDDTVFYDPLLDEHQKRRAKLTTEIQQGLKTRSFVPYFQPQICMANGNLLGFEALARWRHPTRGLVGPGEFIDVAEEAGLIDDIFQQLLPKVCKAVRSWPTTIEVAVNISPVQLADARFVEKLLATLRSERLKPSRLVLEVTENAIIGDMDAAQDVMGRLKNHGIRFSLDDFGTGYSSLSYLSQLPFDAVKIDRSFVSGIDRKHGSQVIVSSIISLCTSLGLKTVGEGVETIDEADLLRALGCSSGQGYCFSRPIDAEAASRLIKKWEYGFEKKPDATGDGPVPRIRPAPES